VNKLKSILVRKGSTVCGDANCVCLRIVYPSNKVSNSWSTKLHSLARYSYWSLDAVMKASS